MKSFLCLLLFFTIGTANAQTYNNEWIDYSHTYYKFKVGSTGLYRIRQTTLATLGIGNTPAEQFQLWRNGKQVPLYTTVQTGAMGSSDYIEFWGEMNDGKPDNIMYRMADYQLNDKWSLETDTAAFFLTVNPAGNNLRLAPATNSLPSALTPEPYFIYTAGKYYKDRINLGNANIAEGQYCYSSAYDMGEGFSSADIGSTTALSTTLSDLYPYTGASPSPTLKINASGDAPNPRLFEIKLNGTHLANQVMDYFDYVKISMPVTAASISSGAAVVDVKNNSLTSSDRMVVATVELTYARQFNFGGATNFMFDLPANATGNYLEITGFNYGSANPVLYDLTNEKRYVGDISISPLVRIALGPSATARKLLLVSEDASLPINVTSFQQRNFINYAQASNQGNYLIISHPSLSVSASGDPVEDYRSYRSSAAGGSYTAKTYMIDQLTDQFGFGIKQNPLAIRNFVRFARNTFAMPPKNVLLLGKGIIYPQYRTFENNANVDKLALIPTFGYPASDNLLTADPGTNEIPNVPIGRISAIDGDEVALYLAKVKQYEAQQAFQSPAISDKAWTKNVVHIVGSADGSLGVLLQNDMDNYTRIISDTLYGANVSKFSKSSAAPVEQNASDRLYKLFEDGIGLMTYFGHSSANSLEFNLDNPYNYNNEGKYPVMIVMGCNAGSFFNYDEYRFVNKTALSEKFVLAKQKGAIAFIASSSFGTVQYLDYFNTHTYTAASTSSYGQSIGELLRESIIRLFAQTTPDDDFARIHAEQSTLHGDPALKLDGSWTKPDYVIEDQLVKVSPSVSVAETHFKLDAKFMNLGKAIDKKIVVELKRTYPDGTIEIVRRDTIHGTRYIDSLSYDISIVPTRDKGQNQFTICVDADNTTAELYETNNCVKKIVDIYEDEARPVYPYAFAIVNKPDIKLMASTANPFSGLKKYLLEIDTTELFNSPLKVVRSINSTGGLLEFSPGISFADSTVYYWRVAPEPSSGEPLWNKSSFVYLTASSPGGTDAGFNQSHFYQHTKSVPERMKYDTASRSWQYTQVPQNLFIQMGTWLSSTGPNPTPTSLAIFINGVAHIRLMCWFSSIVFNVFDPVSFKPWENHRVTQNNWPTDFGEGLYGSTDNDCFNDEVRYYNFEYRYVDTAGRHRMMNLMKNIIPDGYYVAVRGFTLAPAFGYPDAWAADWAADTQYWGPEQSLYHYLKNAGFSGIDSFYRARPWVLVYKKNDPSFTPRWMVGDGIDDNPTLSVDCNTTDTIGYLTSPVFGPSKGWKKLYWRGAGNSVGDTATLSVIGIRNDGSEQTLYASLTTAQQDFDVSAINAVEFPYVKLKLRTKDNVNYTPYQLKYWRVTYTPAPEGALAANIFFQASDTVEVGQPADLKIAFKNISDVPFDSVKVKLTVTDKNNITHIVPIPKRRKLLVNDTLQIGGLINTSNIPGLNTVYIEANPDNDQPEQYHFNNFAYRNLFVTSDSLDPLLDVTFDLVHIKNHDIVSSKPDILVKLRDEARWMLLDDTSLLTVKVKFPDGNIKRYYFNTDTLRFTPASQVPSLDNTAVINFWPYFPMEGEYELQVTGKDRSNNAAGNIEYRAVFRIVNKPKAFDVSVYPNPVSKLLNIRFNSLVSPAKFTVSFFDVTGRIVLNRQIDVINNGRAWIDVSSLPAGLYVAQVEVDGKVVAKTKVIRLNE